MRIEGQDGDARVVDTQVALQASVQGSGFLDNLLLGNGFRHVLDGQVLRDQCHAQVVIDEHAQSLLWLAQSAVGSSRGCHECIDLSGADVIQCALDGFARCLFRLGRLLSNVYFNLLVRDRQQVQLPILGILSFLDDIELCLHVNGLAVVGGHFGAPIYNRCA